MLYNGVQSIILCMLCWTWSDVHNGFELWRSVWRQCLRSSWKRCNPLCKLSVRMEPRRTGSSDEIATEFHHVTFAFLGICNLCHLQLYSITLLHILACVAGRVFQNDMWCSRGCVIPHWPALCHVPLRLGIEIRDANTTTFLFNAFLGWCLLYIDANRVGITGNVDYFELYRRNFNGVKPFRLSLLTSARNWLNTRPAWTFHEQKQARPLQLLFLPH